VLLAALLVEVDELERLPEVDVEQCLQSADERGVVRREDARVVARLVAAERGLR